jgi:hypothetical protein
VQSEDALTFGLYTCVIGEHAGIDGDDARTTADVVCHALSSRSARPGVYDLRVGKLGSKLLFALSDRQTGTERRVFIEGPEEIAVASDRLVAALVEDKPVEQTVNVENVVSSESVTPKEKKVQAGAILGISGQSAVGTPNTMSAGVEVDLQFRLHNLALLGEGRAGGIGSADNRLGYASLGIGARYFLSSAEMAPFVGGGAMLAYFQQNEPGGVSPSGSGLGGYAEVGMAFLRTARASGVVDLRCDLPAFALHSPPNPYGYATNTTSDTSLSMYVVPISLNVGLSFQ